MKLTKTKFAISVVLALPAALAPRAGAYSMDPPLITYRIVPTRFPSRDQVVAAYTDQDFHLDKTGQTDCSALIQAALEAIGKAGGGTMFLSSGTYRLDNPLTLPPGVSLRGELGATSDPFRFQGTILAAYTGEGQADGPPLISLTSCAGISDCMIWYPHQNPANIVPYPPAVNHVSNSTSCENVVFINAYQAYRSGYNMGGRAYVRDLRGTALSVGVEIDGLADTGRVEGVTLSPEYWAHSGLPGAPTAPDSPYRQYMRDDGVGILERRIDWTNTADVSIDGYNKGYCTAYSLNTEDLKKGHLTNSPNGENFDYRIRNCTYGVYVENVANAGMIFTRFDIQASKTAFHLGDKFDTAVTILGSKLASPGLALENLGTGRVVMRDCSFLNGAIATSGVLDSVASSFSEPSCHVAAGDSLADASFFGDSFAVPPLVSGGQTAKAAVHFVPQSEAPAQTFDAPPIDFEAPRGATRNQLFVVTQTPFNAVGDGVTDCTAALQSALKAAGTAGGIVYLPPGGYVVTQPLTIPAGVELRGCFDGPHDANTEGSCILVETGQGSADGPAFLTLNAGSTLRGLNFHYPGQEIAHIVDFPFLIQGQGAGITVADVASANVSRFIDFLSNRCDDAYLDHMEGQPIHTGIEIGGGSSNDTVSDCQFNPSNWTFATIFNAPKVKYPDAKIRGPIVNAYISGLQEHGEVFVLGDCTGLKFYRDFVFAGRYGLHCIAQNGRGPSGLCLELGVDGSTTAVRIDALGAAGFPIVNSQLVVTSNLLGQRHEVELGAEFTGQANVYGLNAWGSHADSVFQVSSGTLRVDGAHVRDPGNPVCDLKGGEFALSASCVRRDPALVPNPLPAGTSASLSGNILPETAGDLKWVPAGSYGAYTDAGAVRVAAK